MGNRFEFCEEETAKKDNEGEKKKEKKDNEGGPVSTCGMMAPLLDPDTVDFLTVPQSCCNRDRKLTGVLFS